MAQLVIDPTQFRPLSAQRNDPAIATFAAKAGQLVYLGTDERLYLADNSTEINAEVYGMAAHNTQPDSSLVTVSSGIVLAGAAAGVLRRLYVLSSVGGQLQEESDLGINDWLTFCAIGRPNNELLLSFVPSGVQRA